LKDRDSDYILWYVQAYFWNVNFQGGCSD